MKIYDVKSGTQALIKMPSGTEYLPFVTRKALTFSDYEVVTDPIKWYNNGQDCKTEDDTFAKNGNFVFEREGYRLIVNHRLVETIC